MKRIFVNDVLDIADIMHENIYEGCKIVSFIGLYEDAVPVVQKLLNYNDTVIGFMCLEPDYDKEYLISLDENMYLYCEKAYQEEYNRYLYICSDLVLIADDCNSAVLKNIESSYVREVSYKPEEDDLDLVSESKKGYTHVSRTKEGKIAGFTKSWSDTGKDGATYYSSFSHYGSNEDFVKKLAKEFGIKLD